MASAFWKGTLSFGLVEIPVSLRPAVDEKELAFTMLDSQDFSPVGNRRYNKKTGREVPWERIVKGYEYEPDEYVVLSDEELKSANVEKSQAIELFAFVQQSEIPAIYFETPYFVEPLKKGSKSYALLRAALEKTGQVGLARVVLRTRQRLAALIVRDSVLMLDLLRYPHDLRQPETANVPDARSKEGAVSSKELALAERLIAEMHGTWDPSEYRDEYRDDIMKLIEDKVRSGQTHTVLEPAAKPREPKGTDVLDLMPLLKESLSGSGRRSRGNGNGARGRASRNGSREAPAARGSGSARSLTRKGPARARRASSSRRRSA